VQKTKYDKATVPKSAVTLYNREQKGTLSKAQKITETTALQTTDVHGL
jgi:hypothetical protein